MKRLTLMLAAGAIALILSGAASAVGPWPGLAGSVVSPQGGVRYTATRSVGSTTLRAISHGTVTETVQLTGLWGIPAVTSVGLAGGLSPDGTLLVLSQPPSYNGLRSHSQFLVVSTRTLTVVKTLTLRGEFGFDAISPGARTLYLIQHAVRSDLVAYRVRGYDLKQNRLVAGVIVAKGEGETMRGYPVSRATSRTGAWVYTLYHRQTGKPFIHALNAARRQAVCIDLTWRAADQDVWNTRLKLSADGSRLLVRSAGATVATVDTKTLRVLR